MTLTEATKIGEWLAEKMVTCKSDITLKGCIQVAKADNMPATYGAILWKITKQINNQL